MKKTCYVAADENGVITGFSETEGVLPGAIASDIFEPERFWEFEVAKGEVVAATPKAPPPPPRQGLTHYAFRCLFSIAEQIVLDNFENPEFRAVHPTLRHFNIMHIATLTTAYKSYEAAKDFDLDDPGTVLFVGTLADLGLLDSPTRVERILAGLPPV